MNMALEFVREFYGGVPGGRPSTDAAMLRAVADLFDRCDNIMNKMFMELGNEHLVGDDIQQDLRRIADRLGDRP